MEPHTINYWSSRLPPKLSGSLHESLANLCLMLEPHTDFFRQISSTGGRAEFFVGWFPNGQAGEVLSHTLLRMIADLRVDLALDIYGEYSSEANIGNSSA
jgi:hypothetical protein